MTTQNDRFLPGSLTGSFRAQSNDWFPVPSPTGTGTGRTGSSHRFLNPTTTPSPATTRSTP